jgi:tellurite resistance protein TerC
MLAIDLGVFNRKSKKISFKEAIAWSAVWLSLAMIFNGWIYYSMGEKPAVEFLTGYLVEKSLSVDNIFVFVLLFSFFKVPEEYQHRVLFWGVIGALLLRAIFIAVGAVLITKFHWIIYVFGIFLIYTGYKMFKKSAADMHPEDNPLVKWFIKRGKVTNEYHGKKFFVNINGKRLATPLFLCLLSIEFTDLIFAVDSIPVRYTLPWKALLLSFLTCGMAWLSFLSLSDVRCCWWIFIKYRLLFHWALSHSPLLYLFFGKRYFLKKSET